MPKPPSSAFDAEMMAIALRMAERGLGATTPNPSVGAVIADEATGEVMRAATTARGRQAARRDDRDCGGRDRARGATIYVTLEPLLASGANRTLRRRDRRRGAASAPSSPSKIPIRVFRDVVSTASCGGHRGRARHRGSEAR